MSLELINLKLKLRVFLFFYYVFFFVNILEGRGNLTFAWIKLKKKKEKLLMRVMHKPVYGNRLCLLDGTYNVYWWPNTIFRVEFDVSCLSLHSGLGSYSHRIHDRAPTMFSLFLLFSFFLVNLEKCKALAKN
jgi:hypothetical protein